MTEIKKSIRISKIENLIWPLIIKKSITLTIDKELFLKDSLTSHIIIKSNNVKIKGQNCIHLENKNYEGFVKNKKWKNVKICNLNIRCKKSTLFSGSGWISTKCNKSHIYNCKSDGNISSHSGGIAGIYNYGSISYCKTTGNLSSKSGGIVSSYNYGDLNENTTSGNIPSGS